MSSVLDELMRCRKWIEDALDYSEGTHIFDDIVAAVLTGRMQLWPAENCCAVTEITHYPRKKAIHVFLLGGNLEGILDLEESMAEFGGVNGCSAMTGAGRPGWERVMTRRTDNGWKRSFVVIERPI